VRTYRIQSGVVRPSIGVRIGRVNNLGLYGKGCTEGSEGKGHAEAGRSQGKDAARRGADRASASAIKRGNSRRSLQTQVRMRVVIDTNVMVSEVLNPHGPPGRDDDRILSGIPRSSVAASFWFSAFGCGSAA
jgi:hypothetical protein